MPVDRLRAHATVTVTALAALALLAPSAALAEHEAGMPEATCIVLAKAGDDVPDVTWQDDDDALVVPVILDCDHLDASDSEIHLQRVDVTYTFPDDRDAKSPRPLRESIDGRCDGGELTLDVTLLDAAQKHRPPFSGLTRPLKVTAHLSFRAKQSTGKKKWCFGSMEWEFEVQPGSAPAPAR